MKRIVAVALLILLFSGFSRAQQNQNLNAVEVHIHHLRKKLGADFIRNVRGLGYTLSKPA